MSEEISPPPEQIAVARPVAAQPPDTAGGPRGPAGAGGPGQRAGPRRGPRGRYAPRRRVCQFCVDKVKIIDYKDVSRLRRYLSDRAKIEPRRKTGTCARHQRGLSEALKRARFMALLPYTAGHIRFSGIVLRS